MGDAASVLGRYKAHSKLLGEPVGRGESHCRARD